MRLASRAVTGLILIVIITGSFLASCAWCREKHVIPIKVKSDVTLLTVRIGDTAIPNILLDTGMPFDGVMIYNPDYRDSLDLSEVFEVRVGGAGSGDASTALMIDSA